MISDLLHAALLSALPLLVQAELQALDDSALSQLNGQGVVYLSGEFSINKDGGVLWSKPASNSPNTWTVGERSCATLCASTAGCAWRSAPRSTAVVRAGQYQGHLQLRGIDPAHSLHRRRLRRRRRWLPAGCAGVRPAQRAEVHRRQLRLRRGQPGRRGCATTPIST